MVDSLSTQMFSTQLLTDNLEGTMHDTQNGTNSVKEIGQAQQDTVAVNKVEQAQDDQKKLSNKQVHDVVDGLNKILQPTNTSIQFKYHEKLHEYYVQVVDSETDKTIKEIPPKKLLDVYASMLEYVGLLVDKKI